MHGVHSPTARAISLSDTTPLTLLTAGPRVLPYIGLPSTWGRNGRRRKAWIPCSLAPGPSSPAATSHWRNYTGALPQKKADEVNPAPGPTTSRLN
ncbi:hypothetical protein ACJZ2D_006139 [Fusarium nematophilum]